MMRYNEPLIMGGGGGLQSLQVERGVIPRHILREMREGGGERGCEPGLPPLGALGVCEGP